MALAEDAARHPDQPPIELLVRDARGAWGENSSSLVDLVLERDVLALIGSTERRGTHLAEMLAAKMHFPVLTLCGADPTITQIPLPWIFSVAPASDEIDPDFARRYSARYGASPDAHAALGYDAAALAASRIRGGAHTRVALRNALASGAWNRGATGFFAFDALGTRINAPQGGISASGGDAGAETPSTRIAGRANEE